MTLSHLLTALAAARVALAASGGSSAPETKENNTMIRDWKVINPTPDLRWTPCFDNYMCARLEVPLDYKNLTAGTTAIAYIKQAASVQPAVGDILFNPGGPGNSGVDEILSSGTLISSLVGEQYNLIGFDPRGVNNSGPAMTCFGNDTLSKQLLDVQYIWPIDSKSNYSIVQEFEWAGAYGDWCTEFNKDTDAKYVGTVAVAHDMLNYIEKKNEAGGEPASDAKLLYYGVSYGTTLGATYAALFPDRIERMILDGVEDSENYYQGGWTTNLFDTDAAIEQLFSTCYAAGPDICPLWLNSTAAIANRTRAIMEAVRADPVPVSDRSVTTYPQLATYEMLAFLIFNSAYSPIQQFPVLAQVLAEMENRNGTTLLQATGGPVAAGISGYLIGCLDSMGRYNLSTVNAWEDHIKGQKAESEWAFETWSTLGLGCRNIRILPPASQMFNGTPSAANTSAPILFASNLLDPVTPIRGAHKMSALFPGSVVLQQNASGHTAGLSATSNCTMGWFRKYFATGEIPPANTTCEVKTKPFQVMGA